MRWKIVETKRKIASTDFSDHIDDIEMSGEKVSYLVEYGVKNDDLIIKRTFVYPLVRLSPDYTQSSYIVKDERKIISFDSEKFVRVEIDGVLSIYSVTKDLNIVHRFFPSTKNQVAYEMIEIENTSNSDVSIDYLDYLRIDSKLTCKGYCYTERIVDRNIHLVKAKEKISICFGFYARFANEKVIKEFNPLEKRRKRVTQLLDVCDLTTGDDELDTMFAFAKIRAGESIFNTKGGKVHSPGGTNYYAAIWCNDQCEYSTPWFGFSNDKNEVEAAKNAMHWFEPFMNDEYFPIPSSIISEGTDFWNGAGDRGDASMFLYGYSKFFLERNEIPTKQEQKMLEWCATYIEKKILPEGVVFSNTDELEGRISSGINLSTSSLSYGAFGYYSILLKRLGHDKCAKKYVKLQDVIKKGIENYFGGEVSGYHTYHYHQGCDVIRAWLCLPPYMGIKDRADESLAAISDKLWKNSSCISTENEKIMWDRSAIYFITALFRSGKVDEAYKKLKNMVEERLLGDRVPYVVEAYPENGMRHLSAESALFCRIITDGLLNISFDEKGFILKPMIPSNINEISIRNIFLDGKSRNIKITNGRILLN